VFVAVMPRVGTLVKVQLVELFAGGEILLIRARKRFSA